MATIGAQLLSPEGGYQRIDTLDSKILYYGSWYNWTASVTGRGFWNNTMYQTSTINSYLKFRVRTSKLRILTLGGGTPSLYPSKVNINIDNSINETFTCRYGTTGGTNKGSYLVYDKYGLDPNVTHTIIVTLTENLTMSIDAFDIDDTGYLVDPYNKLLLQDGELICNTDGVNITNINRIPYIADYFKNNGMINLSNVNNTVIGKLINDKYKISLLRFK